MGSVMDCDCCFGQFQSENTKEALQSLPHPKVSWGGVSECLGSATDCDCCFGQFQSENTKEALPTLPPPSVLGRSVWALPWIVTVVLVTFSQKGP